MLRNAVNDGTEKIVATPHYGNGYGVSTISEVKNYVNKLKSLLEEKDMKIEIYSGHEVYLNEYILEECLDGKIGTINDSNYMLMEFDMNKFSYDVLNIIYEFKIRDIVPIIAHPERYLPVIEYALYMKVDVYFK